MKYRKVISVGALVSLLLVAIFAIPVEAPNGPKTSNMLIHIFNNDAAELESFGTSTGADAIDFVDCILNRTYIERWGMSTDIVLKDYSPIETFQIDINNQRWPTGVTEPRVFDAETGTYKHWYGSNEPWDTKARDFRKALAYLSDKNGWINRILKGYGFRQDTFVPIPALSGFTDYADLNSKGLIYNYNTVTAAAILDAAGFTQGTTPNPYYDPATPYSAQYLRTDPRYGGDLQPLEFYIRMDDVLRRDVARELTAQMRKAGIQVNSIETDRTVCYQQVRVIYDYHLYTGSYDATSLDADIPSSLYNLFHSSKYWGGTGVSYYGGLDWSSNYIGFCDTENDGYLSTCKYSGDFLAIRQAALDAQEREAELVHSIPAYSRVGVKAHKNGWTGTINQAGGGFDNKWSFLNGMNTVNTPLNPADNEIDWGFGQSVLSPNPVTMDLPQDRQLINSIYDSMICRDPYNLATDYGLLAESWSFNPTEQYVVFTLRSGLTFHNGDPVTPEDVKFSIEFNKACGPGVSSAYGNVEVVDHVNTATDEVGLGLNDVKVYLTQASYWSVHLVGFIPILNHNIWMTANTYYGWGYYRGLTDYNLFTNRMLVWNYAPWEEDLDYDGDTDYEEDGCGAFIYMGHAPMGPIFSATSIALQAFTNYCVPQSAISDYLEWSYHMLGDVNRDGRINDPDGYDIQRAMGTDRWTYPWGTGWDEYNPDADINTGTWDMINHQPLVIGDGYINVWDLGKWGLNVDLYASSVTAVEPSETMVARGESLTIDVSISGDFPASFDVTVYYADPAIGTIGPEHWFYFWSLGDVNRNGNINAVDGDLITAALNSQPGDTNWNPDADLDQDNWVGNSDWDIWNSSNGLDIWTYFGQVIVGTQTVPLLQGIGTLTFTWDTDGVPTGTYTIGAYAVPSSEDSNKDDNCHLSSVTVKVTNLIAVYPEITVGPPPRIGETFSIDITVAGVIDLYAWQAGLTFNPSVLEAVSIAEGEFLKRSGVTTLWTPGSIDNVSGIIQYSVCSVTGNNPGVDGSGQLMSVTFRVKNPGESTLHITDVLFLDSSLTLIEPVDAVDGYVKIYEQDIAVLTVTTSATEAYPTWTDPIDITIVVENQGTRTETFDVTAYADTIAIDTKTVTLGSGATTTLVFQWNLAGVPEDTYTIRAEATTLYGEIDTADNTLTDGTVTIKEPGDANGDSILNAYDVGILAKAWGTSVGQPLYDPRADFNGDGTIDTLDHDILKAHWP